MFGSTAKLRVDARDHGCSPMSHRFTLLSPPSLTAPATSPAHLPTAPPSITAAFSIPSHPRNPSPPPPTASQTHHVPNMVLPHTVNQQVRAPAGASGGAVGCACQSLPRPSLKMPYPREFWNSSARSIRYADDECVRMKPDFDPPPQIALSSTRP